MKIFNRGTDPKPGAPQAAAATAIPAPAPPAAAPAPAPAAPAPAPAADAPAAPAPAPAPAAPPAPDLSLILDANVKEMSEKIARLASSLDNAQQERTGFEAKIEQMEDRMRKLSSLTEMISAQYNPFVGDAPSERGEAPPPAIGLAAPALPAAPSATLTLPPPEPAPAAPGVAMPDFDGLPAFAPAPEPVAALAPPEPAPYEPPAAAQPAPAPQDEGVYLWSCAPGFESSMLLLGWADMLLKSAGSREALLSLVNYYHNIGWIGDPARDQLLAYSDGLVAPVEAPEQDWRANVEVHEKSLLFVEKLRAVSRRAG